MFEAPVVDERGVTDCRQGSRPRSRPGIHLSPEKLGAAKQDPDLDGLLFGLISQATGGCHEHAARADHPVGGRSAKEEG